MSDRSNVVLQQRTAANGQVHENIYRQTVSADGRTTTRVYGNGLRTVEAPDFRGTGHLNGTQFVQYRNGLHAAYLPNGHAVYAERFTNVSGMDSTGRPARVRVVERTVYWGAVAGHMVALPRPIRRIFTVDSVGGYATFVYQPVVFSPAFFPILYSPFGAPIRIGAPCPFCPIGTVAFAGGPSQYTNPMDVLGDAQIADAVGDEWVAPPVDAGTDAHVSPASNTTADQPAADASPEPSDPPPPPSDLLPTQADAPQNGAEDINALKTTADQLRGQVTARAQQDAARPDSGGSGETSLATVRPVALVTTNESSGKAPIPIPEDVRDQMRKQVRLGVAQHANGHPLTLPDVAHSGFARIFLFQVASPMDSVSAIAGDRCELGSGDILSFAEQGLAEGQATVQMKVVVAQSGHCLTQDTVEVSVADVQDMLNTFNERLEANMSRLEACTRSKDGCFRQL